MVKVIGKIFKYISFAFFLPFWYMQKLIPRKKKIWIFGAWYGKRYSDNSRHFFLYVKNNHQEIKTIWLTREKSICQKVKKDNGVVYMVNSIQGIYYSLIASNIFISSGKLDVNPYFINGAKIFQLFHGSPLKKIGLDDRFSKANSFFHKKIVPIFFPYVSEYNCDYVVSNAAIFSEKMGTAFNIPLKNVLETGYPRNDILYSKTADIFNQELRIKYKNCKLIYYLPTFRSGESFQSIFNLDDFNEELFEGFLARENLIFISKGHYVNNILDDKRKSKDCRLIHLSDDMVSDTNYMLKDADLLITDYSSAYFDFLLTERPVIFAAFDLDEYLNTSREMYFQYSDIIAGPIVKNWSELMLNIKNIWRANEYSDLIIKKNQLFNKYHDPNSSRRLFEEVSRRIGLT